MRSVAADRISIGKPFLTAIIATTVKPARRVTRQMRGTETRTLTNVHEETGFPP